jgi:hypothetical protein
MFPKRRIRLNSPQVFFPEGSIKMMAQKNCAQSENCRTEETNCKMLRLLKKLGQEEQKKPRES